MKNNFLRLALILGLLSAVGPFAIDMYLPALPVISLALNADVHSVQLSLMSFFVAFAVSQMVYGPASDVLGRKPPLYGGIALFIAGSVGCALASDISWLIGFRFVQGLGAGAPSVVPRAIVRDLHTGVDATRLMSLLMLVFSASPILAPLAGNLVTDAAGWRAIFWAVGAIGGLGLVLTVVALEETRPAAQRLQSDMASTLRAFALLLRDRHFLGVVAIGAFSIGAFFIYLANSSFVMINHYGLAPREYSLAFAVNAASFILTSQFAGRLAKRHGPVRVVWGAATGFAISLCAGAALNVLGFDQVEVMIVMLMIAFGFFGLVIPTSSVMAFADHGEIAGAASALMGMLQTLTGAVVIAVMGLFVDGTARPMLFGTALAAIIAWVIMRATLSGRRDLPA